MIHTFQCPNCHASLDYEGNSRAVTMRCEYCNTTIIVPEKMRQPGRPSASASFGVGSEQAQKLGEIMELIHKEQKIQAIKLFHETFGVGLKEAKDAVDALERNEAVQLGNYTAVQGAGQAEQVVSTSLRFVGCFVVVVILVMAGMGLLAFLLPMGSFIEPSGPAAAVPAVQVVDAPQESSSVFDIQTLLDAVEPTAVPGYAQIIMTFGGEEGVGPGFFNDTRRIGVDGDGNIYTGDYSDGRIQVFDANGKFLAQWNVRDDLYMIGMTVDRQGIVYIIDRNQINRYEGMSGALLEPLDYEPANFRTLTAAANGSIVAYGPGRLVRFDAQGNVTLDARNLPEMDTTHEDIAVDGAGNIYVLGREVIYKFDNNGNFDNRFGSQGDGPDQFHSSPWSIAVDGRGFVFVNDFKGILVFDDNGRYVDIIEEGHAVAFDMVFNDQNELLMMDRNGNQVVKYEINK